jgi:site-specific recombinase XerD
MNKKQANTAVNEFWALARSFLKAYLPEAREVSPNTTRAYKQALEALIKYLEHSGVSKDRISLGLLTAERLEGFMVWMAKDNDCKPRTCNLRLSAVKTFLRYCARRDIANEAINRGALDVPAKKVRRGKIEYMSREAVAAIIRTPNIRKAMGRRDMALLTMLYDSAARVQEIVDIRLGDLHLDGRPDADSEQFVTLHGKGDKLRNVALSPKTATLLVSYLKEFHPQSDKEAPLFYARRAGSVWSLSTDSVSRVLKENADRARVNECEIPDRVHCHLMRKSRAMHLYISGVPLSVIMELLGHASMSTTNGFYAFVTWDMVSAAMRIANEGHLDGEQLWREPDMLKQLYSLD